MILRRLTTALRKQDWVTVLVETLIVVFGVFIGLQVNNWNAGRIEQGERSSLLQRLETEFTAQHPRVEVASKRLSLSVLRTGQLIDYLRESDVPPDDEDILLIVEAPIRFGMLPPVTATYQEMLSTGGLSRIGNEDLRNALVRYGQNAEQFQVNYSGATDLLSRSNSAGSLLSATRMRTDWSLPNDQSFITSFDWQKLQAADPQLYAIYIRQKLCSRYADAQLAEVQTILALLKAETK